MSAPSNNGRSIFLSKKTTLHWVAKPQRGAPGYIHVRVLRNRTIFSRTVRGVAGSCRNAYMLQFAAKCFKQERNPMAHLRSIDQRKKNSRSKVFALLNQQKLTCIFINIWQKVTSFFLQYIHEVKFSMKCRLIGFMIYNDIADLSKIIKSYLLQLVKCENNDLSEKKCKYIHYTSLRRVRCSKMYRFTFWNVKKFFS